MVKTVPMLPDAAPQAHSKLGSFTVLDWVGTILAGNVALGLLAFPVASFETTFRDLGSAEQLPALTRLVISSWFPPMLGLIAVGGIVLGIRRRAPLRRRRAWIVAAFVVAAAGLALCLFGMYLPIFSLAGKIKSE